MSFDFFTVRMTQKGLWDKIPADGHTTLAKPYLDGQTEDGMNPHTYETGERPSHIDKQGNSE